MPETPHNTTTTTTLSAAAATPQPEKTTLFNRYEIGKLLGYGGFAKVYHARDLKTGKSVAIKSISKSKIFKNNLTAHIEREVNIMTRVRHPHVIKLFEVLATKTKIYFIMEFAKGGELFAKISKGRFSEDLSRRYFYQLISAVHFCHLRGVYHRDLKPENLLLDENWNLKVTDFGLGAVVDLDPARPNNGGVLHTLCGTPAYVAPEILGKKGYDGAKVDIWSCGIILFVLNAGFLPFNDTNLMNLYRKIYRGEFKCPKFMSLELKDLLTRILDTDPSNRISIQGIMDHPWLKNGGVKLEVLPFIDEKDVGFDEDIGGQNGNNNNDKDNDDNDNDNNSRFLNAFDLISYSPGFNLSGLFREEEERIETFSSKEAAETVVERVERAARGVEGVVVERLRCGVGVKVEGQNGDFGLVVGVRRLTEDLVVVQVRKREKDLGLGHKFWKEKLRPMVCDLVYKTGRTGPSGSAVGPSCVV